MLIRFDPFRELDRLLDAREVELDDQLVAAAVGVHRDPRGTRVAVDAAL